MIAETSGERSVLPADGVAADRYLVACPINRIG